MATKTPKLKSVVSYIGKGKKNPVLPEGSAGTLTLTQGTTSVELPVYRVNGDVLFAKRELLAALGLKPAQAKSVPVIALGEGKKPIEYVGVTISSMLAATARVLVGPSPATAYFLNPVMDQAVERLIVTTPHFGHVQLP